MTDLPWPEPHGLSFEELLIQFQTIRDRLRRATTALNDASVPHAVAGGNAVAAWIHSMPANRRAILHTSDVDILVRRSELEAVRDVLIAAGFQYRKGAGIHVFYEGDRSQWREGIHLLFADEKVRADYAVPAPKIDESEEYDGVRYLNLLAVLAMKLTSFREKDRLHVMAMIEVGLVRREMIELVPAPLAERLRSMFAVRER